MKYLFPVVVCLLFSPGNFAQTINDIQGNSMNLDSCAGKKILVVILPRQQDTSLGGQMTRFQQTYSTQVVVIGLVASDPDSLSSQYADLIAAGIFITQGIPGSVTASDRRSSVLQYLSGISRNSLQPPDVIGNKYFLSEKGSLFADGAYNMNLDSQLVSNIIRTQVPGGH